MTRIRYIGDRHPIALLLRALGGDGLTTPWWTIYIRAWAKHDRGLLRHEICHIRQMQREGQIRFWSRYCWALLTVGYEANPYEVEAYRAQRAYQRRLAEGKPLPRAVVPQRS